MDDLSKRAGRPVGNPLSAFGADRKGCAAPWRRGAVDLSTIATVMAAAALLGYATPSDDPSMTAAFAAPAVAMPGAAADWRRTAYHMATEKQSTTKSTAKKTKKEDGESDQETAVEAQEKAPNKVIKKKKIKRKAIKRKAIKRKKFQ